MFWFKKRLEIPKNPGWNPDPIDHRDYRFEEILGTPPPITWEPMDQNPEPLFPIKRQNGSGSCVGHSVSKVLGACEFYEGGTYRDLSARFIYAQRSNEGEGMYLREAMKIGIEKGCSLESLLPSQGLNEEQMNKTNDILIDTKQIALVYKAKNYLYCDMNFDNLASILEQKIPIALGIAGTTNGWRNPPNGIVRPPQPGEDLWYHAIAIMPENKKGKNYGLINGRKSLIIDNSWSYYWGLKGQCILQEDYLPFMRWNFFFEDLPDDWRDKAMSVVKKPKYEFKNDLYYGMKENPEVKILQQALAHFGFFPFHISFTGNYYSITQEAVQTFQVANNIASQGELGFGRFGPKSRETMNKHTRA